MRVEHYASHFFVRWQTEASPSAGKNTWVILVQYLHMDMFEVHRCHLSWQMRSQYGSQKLLQRLVSHELTVYLSIFNLFKLNELWPYYQKHVNQIILNQTIL